MPLSDSQENRVRAQRYLYRDVNRNVVLLGSSLSGPVGRYLPKTEFCSLAFSGMGVVDGLEVVERSGFVPSVLLIETNKMLRTPAPNFHEQLFQPQALRELRGYSPCLQQEFQLANLLVPLLQHSPESEDSSHPPSRQPPDRSEAKRLIIERQIEMGLKELSWRPVPLNVVQERIAGLRQRGSRVVFFEIPEDPRISDSKLAEVWRGELHQAFSDYTFLARADGQGYETTDGEHLTLYSGYQFAEFLRERLQAQGLLPKMP